MTTQSAPGEREIQPWDSDHRSLVGVLWAGQHDGLIAKGVVKGSAIEDELASRIMRSDWMKAVQVHAAAEVSAERDQLRKMLAFVLGEFDQDRNQYTGAVLDLWQGTLTNEEMTSAREALEVPK